MKNKTKYTKRLLYAFIPLATVSVVAPVLSISNTTKHEIKAKHENAIAPFVVVNPDNSALKDFLTKVNDHSTDASANTLLNTNTNLMLVQEWSFYKGLFIPFKNTIRFGVTSLNSLLAKITDLANNTDASISSDLKVAIGKWMLNKYAYENFMTQKGIDGSKSLTQLQIEAKQNGNITDASESSSPTDFKYDGNTIPLIGQTGTNINWSKNNGSDNVYNISNQDVLNYYLSVLANSAEFTKLVHDLANDKATHTDNPSDKSLIQLVNDFFTNGQSVLNIGKTISIDIEKLPHFGLLNKIDLTDCKDDNQAFVKLMNSGWGQEIYGNNYQNDVSDFQAYTDNDDKNDEINHAIRKLLNIVQGFQTINVNGIKQIITNTTDANKPLNDADAWRGAMSFAKLLVDNSNKFTSDVQIRITDEDFSDGIISIKTGHNPGYWTQLLDDSTVVNQVVPGDSLNTTSISYTNYEYKLFTIMPSLDVIYQNQGDKHTLDNDKLTFIPESEKVWQTNSNNYGYAKLAFDFNGTTSYFDIHSPKMHVNDSDHDSSIKNGENVVDQPAWVEGHTSGNYDTPIYHAATYKWAAVPWEMDNPNSPLTWTQKDGDKPALSNSNLSFYWWSNNDTAGSHDWNGFTDSINSTVGSIFNDLQTKVDGWKNGSQTNNQYDPTLSTSFKVTLTHISIGEVRFNTYNGTYSDYTYAYNFRFNDVVLTFATQIVQQ